MRSETLKLSAAPDNASALKISHALNAINGVSKIRIANETASVDVDFNEDLTSIEELHAVLQRAGFSARKAAHGEEGVCCGGCGG